MTEQELCQLYLSVVEEAVDVFEPLWTDDSQRVPNSGFFDFRKYTDWEPKWYAEVITVPGSGQVIYCYSLLLSETNRETFGQKKLSRAALLDRCIKVLRWCALTSAFVDKPYDYLPAREAHDFYQGKNWRRKIGYRADIMGWPTLAAARLWDKLDPETRKLLESLMINGAPKERPVRVWGPGGGGNHDQVKQDLASTLGAAYLFPQRPDHPHYMDIVRGEGIDLVSTWHDQANNTLADGRKIRDWSKGWNLYQDYSSDHHGWSQLWYGSDLIFEGRSYLEVLSAATKVPVPEVFRYPGNGFDGVREWIKTLCLPEGEPASVHGMEYDLYYGSGLLGYCYGAVLKKDPVAAALEEQAARMLRRHIRAVREYDYHRNSFAKAATAYLLHKIAGPRAEPPPLAEAFRRLEGTYHYRSQQNLIHRAPNKWVSFSWGSISGGGLSRMCGFVVPNRGLGPDPEPLIYLHPNSFIGSKTVKWENGRAPLSPAGSQPPDVIYKSWRDDVAFQTAGVVGEPGMDRFYAFHSFDEGPCVMFTVFRALQPCTLSYTGLPVFFYAREGITRSRAYYDAQGTQPLEQGAQRTSPWWCVNDMLGVAALGGSGQIKIERQVGFNWARTAAYKDKCDAVYLSAVKDRKVEPGEPALDLAVAFYPDTPHEQVARASELLHRNADTMNLPEGWKGIVVPDAVNPAKRYLSIANLARGAGTCAVELSFDEGAPVLPIDTMITGKSAMIFLSLEGLESFGHTLELYAESLEGTRVRTIKETHRRYLFDPVGEEKVKVRVRYAGKGAESFAVLSLDEKHSKTIPAASLDETQSFVLDLDRPVFLDVQGKAYADDTAPAVEIADVAVREDGRVTIEVAAQDQSDVEKVELYCDDKLVGQLSEPPHVWLHRPGNGAHTYYAVATDASEAKNKRTSFKRTIVVEIGKPCP
jgi:hypothetical protein